MARRNPPRESRAARYTPKKDEALVNLARKRFNQADAAETNQRERELADLQFYAGDQWPLDVIASRQGQPGNANLGLPPVPARPSLTINKVREPVRQVLNQERQSELGVEIVAIDDFGDASPKVTKEELELREGLVRRIQRDSQAQDARSWAFQRATIAGRGFWRVMTRYVPGSVRDQDIYIDRLYNQASVLLDPAHEAADGSDADWGFIGSDIPWDRYKAEYGRIGDKPNTLLGTTAQDWRALGDELPGWFSTDAETRSVRVVEYWRVEREPVDLVELTDGRVVPADELPDDAQVAVDEDGEEVRRKDIRKVVKWVKLDGVQVLDETDWPGKYIPIIKVVGEELQPYDQERRSEGMVRPARDANQGFNVMVSKWVEQIGLAPIPPWIMAAGQDEGFENEWALANTRTLTALHYNQKDLTGTPAPAPSRTSITMDIAAIAGSVQLFDQAIKSTTAVPDPTLGNIDPSLRSGKAIKQLLDQSVRGTSHFLDNLQRSIRYEGMIVNDLLFSIYGRPGRIARLMNPVGETRPVRLHQPFVPHPETGHPLTQVPMNGSGMQPVTEQTPNAQLYTLTEGATFNVTVKVTKNYDTRREQQESVLSELVQADPQQMGVVGDLLFKYNDGPGHEELEERYKALLVPPVAAIVSGKAPIPPEAQAQIAQLQQQLQALKPLADQNQAKLMIAQSSDQTKVQIADINAQTTITAAEIKAGLDDFKAQIQVLSTLINTAKEERLAEHEHANKATSMLHDAAHEVAITAVQHQHERNMAQLAHNQALEQQTNAAALQPEPAQEAGNGST